MDRRLTNRDHQMEMILASLFWAKQFNVIPDSCQTGKQRVKSRRVTALRRKSSEEATKTTLYGHCIYQASGVPLKSNSTKVPVQNPKQICSGHEVFLSIIATAVNRMQVGVLRFLERAELKEADSWYASDYRLASQIVTLADKGKGDPYTLGFIQLFGKHPSKVVSWWRDRQKLLQLSQATNCPTPLLVANRAKEALAIIPDFDPLERSYVGTTVEPGSVSLGKLERKTEKPNPPGR